jgi:hypothetical protein
MYRTVTMFCSLYNYYNGQSLLFWVAFKLHNVPENWFHRTHFTGKDRTEMHTSMKHYGYWIRDKISSSSVKRSFLSHNKIKQTPWPESASELYLPSDSLLSANLVTTFVDSWVLVRRIPYGRRRAATLSSKYLLNCIQEAGWTPFQNLSSEKLVAKGTEPGTLDL